MWSFVFHCGKRKEKYQEVGDDLSVCVLFTSPLRLNQNKEFELNGS